MDLEEVELIDDVLMVVNNLKQSQRHRHHNQQHWKMKFPAKKKEYSGVNLEKKTKTMSKNCSKAQENRKNIPRLLAKEKNLWTRKSEFSSRLTFSSGAGGSSTCFTLS